MKVIKLKSNGLGRYDDVSPFIITDNKLEIKVELPNYNGEFYLVTENNGKTEKRLLPRNGTVTLERLTTGELNAAVKHYLKGALIREYKVEPLLLKEVDGNLSSLPEIEALTRRICGLERAFKEYTESTEEREKTHESTLNKRLDEACVTLSALLRFAYDDFKNNVYLGGGSEKDFNAKYGLDYGKGENEND